MDKTIMLIGVINGTLSLLYCFFDLFKKINILKNKDKNVIRNINNKLLIQKKILQQNIDPKKQDFQKTIDILFHKFDMLIMENFEWIKKNIGNEFKVYSGIENDTSSEDFFYGNLCFYCESCKSENISSNRIWYLYDSLKMKICETDICILPTISIDKTWSTLEKKLVYCFKLRFCEKCINNYFKD